MNLAEYFKRNQGTGILATANGEGEVNSAIYARPHFLDDQKPNHLSFIMRDRLSHKNLESNPCAFYTFIENDGRYQGKRIAIKMVSEEMNSQLIQAIKRRSTPSICFENAENENLFLVHFEVTDTRPLVGT